MDLHEKLKEKHENSHLQEKIEKLEEELRTLKKRHSFALAAMDSLPNPVFIKDENAKFLFFNRKYSEAFGMKREDYIGKSVLDLEYLSEEDRRRYQDEDLEIIKNASVLSYEVDFQFADGQHHPSLYWSSGIHDDDGEGNHGLVGEIVDISRERLLQQSLDKMVRELKISNVELEKLAEVDPGTELYNRNVLGKKVMDMLKIKVEYDSVCVLMSDLDHFKRVNDTYGHLKGDEILAQFAGILKRECRSDDLPVRYGGEEFLLFLHNANLEVGRSVAERIRKHCEAEMRLPNGEPVTVSIGVILLSSKMSLQDNLARLDQRLYMAKENGRNCVVVDTREF